MNIRMQDPATPEQIGLTLGCAFVGSWIGFYGVILGFLLGGCLCVLSARRP